MNRLSISILVLLIWLPMATSAQYLHLSKEVYMQNDTIQGVAFFSNEGLIYNSYHASLFTERGERIISELFYVTSGNTPFWIRIPDDVGSGRYTVQVNNNQNGLATHAKNIVILGEETGLPDLMATSSASSATESKPLFEVTRKNGVGTVRFLASDEFEEVADISLSVTDYLQNVNSPHIDSDTCYLVANHEKLDRGLPDYLEGYHLTGKVIDQNGSPVPNQTLLLSYFNDELELLQTSTDRLGNFAFYNFSAFGNPNGYLRIINSDSATRKSIVFDPSPAEKIKHHPGCFEVSITKDEAEEIRRLSGLDKRVKTAYGTTTRKPVWTPDEPAPLLRRPDQLINLDDYIAQKSTKSLIKEVVPYVFFVKNQLKVFSTVQRKTFESYPLLLINGVYATNEEVLNLAPNEIKFVELINDARKLGGYGPFATGGIVSFITRNGYEFSTSATPIEFKGYQMPLQQKTFRRATTSIPYFPSVLYWSSSMDSDPVSGNSASFDLPDHETKLILKASVQLQNGSVYYHQELVDLINE